MKTLVGFLSLAVLTCGGCRAPVVEVARAPQREAQMQSLSALGRDDLCYDLEVRGPGASDLVREMTDEMNRIGMEVPGGATCPVSIEVEVEVLREIPAARGPQSAYHLHVTMELVDREAGHRRAVDDEMLHLVGWGASADEVIARRARGLVDISLAPITLALLEQPRVYAISTHDDELFWWFRRKIDTLVAVRRARIERAHEVTRAEAEDEHAPMPRTLVTPPLAEQYYLGESHTGALVMLTEPHYMDLLHGNSQLTLRAESEQIVTLDADGTRSVVVEHPEFDAFPVIGDGGRTLVFGTRDPDGTGQLVAFDLSTGTPRVLRVLEPGQTVAAQVADAADAVFYRLFDETGVAVHRVATDGGADPELLRAAVMGSPEPSADGERLWVPYGDQSVDTIAQIDVATGVVVSILGAGRQGRPEDPRSASRFTYAAPLPDTDALIVVERSPVDGAFIGRYELGSEHYERLAALAVERRVELSPDGRWLAIDVANASPPDDPDTSDIELALVDTTSGKVHWLTSNTRDDRLGLFSADGQSLYVRQASPDASSLMSSRVYRVDVSGL